MEAQTVDYSRKWYVLAAVAMGIFLATIDGSIVNVALPTLVRELNTDFPTVQWVVLVYLLTLATLLLSIGRLGDMIGKKPIYATGFVVFTLGSVLCGLAPSVYWLIFFRVVQAVGAAMIMALGLAIVTEAFPPQERGRAIGITGSVVSVGIVIGPTAGGIIIDSFSWHWIFFVNLPVGILGTLMVLRFVPDFHPAGRQKFDFLGAVTLFFSLLALLLALTFGQRIGFASPVILGSLAAWLGLLGLFVWIENRTAQPMIDLTLFRDRLFSINLVTGFITFFAIAGALILIPFYLENVLGYSTRQVGLLLAVVPVVLGITAPISGSLSDRTGTRLITMAGLLVLVCGYFLLSYLSLQTTVLMFVALFLPTGIGMGIFQSPNNSAIMGAAPRERLGVASGLLAITRSLGQTTGIAVLGALWAGRVLTYVGRPLSEGATAAPAPAQVAGLHDTFRVIAGLMAVALALSFWAFWEERRAATVQPGV
ncbi:MAG: MFS transporter [Anaerolineales bacterium]|nr:MFS transporter [Anaerolineales bacterium]